MKRFALGLSALTLAAAIAAPAAASTPINIWSTGFETSLFEDTGPFEHGELYIGFGGATPAASEGLTGFGTKTYHNATDGTFMMRARDLGAHEALVLSFDLAFIDSWDGLSGNPAPDILFVDIDGVGSFQFTTNSASGSESIFGPGVVLQTGTDLGFNPSFNDTIVRYNFQFAHTAADWQMTIRFGGAGFQGGTDESWAIDNFSLGAIESLGGGAGAVPEPGTWALMIGGFGLAGTALRRRRAAIA